MSEEELIEWAGVYQGTSNIHKLRALYSMKKRKFIKGFYAGNRVHGDIRYKVFPGRYIVFYYHSWWQNDPPRQLQLSLVDIKDKDKTNIIAWVRLEFYKPEVLSSFNLPQLTDFYDAVPGYHSYPRINFEKVYSEEDNDKLIRFILDNNKKIIREGEEHE
jgi:hypothetical protein